MRNLLFVLFVVLVFLPMGISAQDQEQIALYGYSYFVPPEDVGTVTTVVGMLEPPVGFTYPFSVDFGTYEYTFYFETVIVAVMPGPFSTDLFYADTGVFIYEDPAQNADYGADPPNGTSPSTFQDGTLALQGTFSSIMRSDDPFGFFEPVVTSGCTFTGGTKLPELAQGPNWSVHGGLILNDPTTPPGYQHAWILKIFFTGPLPIEDSTWGSIKAQYADE